MGILTEELADVMRAADREYEALAEQQAPAIPYLLRVNAALVQADLGVQRFIHQKPGEISPVRAWQPEGSNPETRSAGETD
jgi:hypothetical protein